MKILPVGMLRQGGFSCSKTVLRGASQGCPIMIIMPAPGTARAGNIQKAGPSFFAVTSEAFG